MSPVRIKFSFLYTTRREEEEEKFTKNKLRVVVYDSWCVKDIINKVFVRRRLSDTYKENLIRYYESYIKKL